MLRHPSTHLNKKSGIIVLKEGFCFNCLPSPQRSSHLPITRTDAAPHLARTEELVLTVITTTCVYVQGAIQERIVTQVRIDRICPSHPSHCSQNMHKDKHRKTEDLNESIFGKNFRSDPFQKALRICFFKTNTETNSLLSDQ